MPWALQSSPSLYSILAHLFHKMADGVLPDLHHKMSKKVAQLTKVIYHLNAKNEEHDLELTQLADKYENEIDTIMKDASAKLSEFRRQLDIKKEEASYQAALDKSAHNVTIVFGVVVLHRTGTARSTKPRRTRP